MGAIDIPKQARFRPYSRLEPQIEVTRRENGAIILAAPKGDLSYAPSICEKLYEQAKTHPDRVFLAERQGGEGWTRLTYAVALEQSRAVSQWLIDGGFDQSTPLMILSGNSVNHALMTFGALLAGVPVVPVSPPYSLLSTDFVKLDECLAATNPKAVYVDDATAFARALARIDLPTIAAKSDADHISLLHILATPPSDAVEQRHKSVTPDMIAKILFTSGSTGVPKAVINTHQNLVSAAAMRGMVAQKDPLGPPEIALDWLPWHHTFGGNAVLNGALYQGNSLYLDDGRPLPGQFNATIRNIIELQPTQFTSVPAAFAMLAEHLESDPALSKALFSRVKGFTYGGAALSQDVFERIQAVAEQTCGERIHFATGCGSTETGSLSTGVFWQMDTMGQIGLPLPGSQVKMVPMGEQFEMWVKGPQVMPGYLDATLNAEVFDADGYFNTGDAVTWVDPNKPLAGLRFAGRTAENFKLHNGTWVQAGTVRLSLIAALSPLVADAVIVGPNRENLGALVWPNPAKCLAIAGLPVDGKVAEALASDRLRAFVTERLATFNQSAEGSSGRVSRLRFMVVPPSLDTGEITDKRYVNQGAVMKTRVADIEALYATPPLPDVFS